MFKETLKISVKTLLSNKMRTFLTVLGVIIGIASIIALTAITEGATSTMMKELSSLGSDKLMVSVANSTSKHGFNDSDIEKISEIEGILNVSPNLSGSFDITKDETRKERVAVEGKDHIFFEKNDSVILGRGINYLDVINQSSVVVIGEDLWQDLFKGEDPLGEKIRIKGVEFVIIGVSEKINSMSFSSGTDEVYIPVSSAYSTLNMGNIKSLDVYFDDSLEVDTIKADVERELFFMFNSDKDAYNVFSIDGILSMVDIMNDTMGGLLAGIAAISLLVGGIGIMNMMLTSVTERRSEIGLKKALGAPPSTILLQFIVEAVIISVAGGILGLGLGSALAYVFAQIFGFAPLITMSSVALAMGFSFAVGLIFGIFPAKKAAALSPIEALRAL